MQYEIAILLPTLSSIIMIASATCSLNGQRFSRLAPPNIIALANCLSLKMAAGLLINVWA
jgi:hypothetical protein